MYKINLTHTQEKYYKKEALSLERKLNEYGKREWQVEFDKDYFSTDVQQAGFVLGDTDHILGDIDMKGSLELNNEGNFNKPKPINRFRSEEVIILGNFANKLKIERSLWK